MRKRKISIISAVLLCSLLLSVFVINNSYGQSTDKKEDGKICKKQQGCDKRGPFNFIPNLTEDQKTKIKELHLNLQKEVVQIKNQINEKEAHLKTVSMLEKVDMTEVNKTIDEVFALKASLAKKKAAFHQDVRNLLTTEQKVVFDAKADCKKQKGHNMRKGDGSKKCSGDGNKKGMDCKSKCGGSGHPAEK